MKRKSMCISATRSGKTLLTTAKLTVLILQLFMKEIEGAFTVSPENLAVVKGEQGTLACSANPATRLDWSANLTGSGTSGVTTGHDVKDDFRSYLNVTNTGLPGQYNLVIEKADEYIAGFWICVETPDAVTAELIILQSHPMCHESNIFNSTGFENITLICNVDYKGNWPPTIAWTSNNTDYTQGAELEIINGTSLTSTLRVLRREIAGKNENFTCVTFFTEEAYKGKASAGNVPAYRHECTVPISDGISEPPKPWPLWFVILSPILAAALASFSVLVIWACLRSRSQIKQDSENLYALQLPLRSLPPIQNGGMNTYSPSPKYDYIQ